MGCPNFFRFHPEATLEDYAKRFGYDSGILREIVKETDQYQEIASNTSYDEEIILRETLLTLDKKGITDSIYGKKASQKTFKKLYSDIQSGDVLYSTDSVKNNSLIDVENNQTESSKAVHLYDFNSNPCETKRYQDQNISFMKSLDYPKFDLDVLKLLQTIYSSSDPYKSMYSSSDPYKSMVDILGVDILGSLRSTIYRFLSDTDNGTEEDEDSEKESKKKMNDLLEQFITILMLIFSMLIFQAKTNKSEKQIECHVCGKNFVPESKKKISICKTCLDELNRILTIDKIKSNDLQEIETVMNLSKKLVKSWNVLPNSELFHELD